MAAPDAGGRPGAIRPMVGGFNDMCPVDIGLDDMRPINMRPYDVRRVDVRPAFTRIPSATSRKFEDFREVQAANENLCPRPAA